MTDVDVLKIIRDNRGSDGSLVISIKLNSLAELEGLFLREGSARPASTLVETPPALQDGKDYERPITQAEAIQFLGKTRQTFFNLRRKGIIKGYRLSGRVYFYRSQLLACLQEC